MRSLGKLLLPLLVLVTFAAEAAKLKDPKPIAIPDGLTQEKLTEIIATFRESGVTDSEIRIAFGKVMNDRFNGGA